MKHQKTAVRKRPVTRTPEPSTKKRHPDQCKCGGLWIGGQCGRCGAECKCAACVRGRKEIAAHEQRKKLFIRELAVFFAEKQALRSIGLQMGDQHAKEWAKLRGLTPLFGYPTVDEAEKTLSDWLLGS